MHPPRRLVVFSRPGPSAILHARVQAPGARPLRYPCGAVPILSPPLRVDLLCRATPPPFAAVLLPCASVLPFAVALQSTAVPSRLIAERLAATPSPCTALGREAFPSRTPLCSASPLRCRAGLRRRVILHFKAVARQISEELCLRLATLRSAFARPCSSKQRLRCPYQSIAVACRGFASPSPRAALLSSAVAVPGSSWPSYPMPLRIGSLPVLRGAVRFLATPSPIAPMLCRRLGAALPCSSFAMLCLAALIHRHSFAERGSAVHFRRVAGQSKSLPSQLSA